MRFVEQLQLLDRLNALIRKEGTGSPEELANRLSISRSSVHRQICILKKLGAKVKFCHHSNSYVYEEEFNLGNLGDLKF